MINNAALTSRFRATKVPLPSVTIRALLHNALPEGTFLACGNPATQVSWARSISQPNSLSNVVEGDLVLIAKETLWQHNEPEHNLTRLISDLLPIHVQAICIQGDIGIAALEAAAHHQIAVLYLPDSVSIDEVERSVIRHIMGRQSELDRRDAELQQELTRHATNNLTIHATLRTLANAIQQPVTVHDPQGFRIAHSLPTASPQKTAYWNYQLALLQDAAIVSQFADVSTFNQYHVTELEHTQIYSAPLQANSVIIGYLSIIKTEEANSDFIPIALARGTAVCGLLLSKQRSVTTETRGQADWITAWLEGQPANDQILTSRAEQFAFDPNQVYVICVLRWNPEIPPRRSTRAVKPEQLMEQIRQEIVVRRLSAIVGQYRDRTVLFLPLEKAQHTGRMKQYSELIAKQMSELLGGMVMCGVSRPAVGLTLLRRCFQEAERAMRLTEQLWEAAHTSFFADLSLSELLLNIQNHHQLQQFCQDWLSDILEYDQQNNSDLLLTMSVYFANNGNMAATAKQLTVHRNTLVYRLNRIAEITQLDMDDADVQLNLHLAIKAYHLLERVGLI